MSGDAARTGAGAAAGTGLSRVADALSADAMREWAQLGTATVYEASGRQGLVDGGLQRQHLGALGEVREHVEFAEAERALLQGGQLTQ